MNARRRILCLLASWVIIWTAGCQPATPAEVTLPAPTLTLSGSFIPYQTTTPSPTATRPINTPPTWTPLPTITPTPRTYTVKSGDDMTGIALRYRVPLADLKTANPSVNPRIMKIGTVLIIPGVAPGPSGAAEASATPQPVSVGSASCTADQAGGAWCFVQVRNQSSIPAIGVSVQLRLVEVSGKQAGAQTVALPLDLLAAGTAQPLAAYFPPPLAAEYQVEVQLASALPASSAAERYPQVQVAELKTEIAPNGMSATAAGKIQLKDGQADPAQLAVLVIGYAEDGSVVGLRRWDSVQPPHAGQPVAFQIPLYSVSSPIRRVEVMAEARK
jgi:LysM repeat protein